MDEFIKKLIERLEECKNAELSREDNVDENGMYNDCEETYDDGESNGRYQMCVKMLKFVKQLAEEYKVFGNSEQLNGCWIPVSERLPEEKENPITHDYLQYPVMVKSNETVDMRYYYYGNGHWRHGFQIMDKYVTHWMDIKPYQPEGE